jgi:tRNA A-37 threonylcarbamoyl transferase component Bud32/tetratricopeptide (TPR) repeat protein
VADLDPAARSRYLDEQGIDARTRAEVERLVAFDKGSATFLGTPLASVAAEIDRSTPATDVERVGPYRIIRELGRGGMGSVYEGERSDGEVKLRVAIKFVSRGMRTDFIVERFRRERQILANLNHPNICRMIDAGTADDGSPYLVMEMIEGQTVDKWAQGRSIREICGLFRHVCDAVQHAHMHMVVHRDLKPANILVTGTGDPKLLDFGIAKLLDGAPPSLQSTVRALTPDYASPEQIAGLTITAATDIYGLGCVLYHLLTGQPPRRKSRHDMPPPASSVKEGIPADIDAILRRALQLEPSARYATASELGEELDRWLTNRPVKAVSGGWSYVAGLLVRRHRWLVAGIAAVTLLLTAGTVYAWWRASRAETDLRTLAAITDETHLALASAPDSKTMAEALKRQWSRRQEAGLADAGVALNVARQLRALGDAEGAARLLAGLNHDVSPALIAPLLTLESRSAFDAGRLDDAAQFARRSVPAAERIASSSPAAAAEALTQHAAMERHLGRLAEARRSAERAIEWLKAAAGNEVQLARAYDQLARILEDSGDLTQALKMEEAAVKLQPEDWTMQRRLGEILEASGERERALKQYTWVLDHANIERFASPAERAESLIHHVRYIAAVRNSGEQDAAENALRVAMKNRQNLFNAFPLDRAVRFACARLDLADPAQTGEIESRLKADAEFVQLLKPSPQDAEILREFAANRLALAALLPPPEAATSCADGLNRLKATPHPAVALLGRQIQQICASR